MKVSVYCSHSESLMKTEGPDKVCVCACVCVCKSVCVCVCVVCV